MPVTLTAPGVYIEELPSGTRTVSGVPTSITAFVGRAARGPVNEPTAVRSWAAYERQFGGLWTDSPMSYAVRHFFMNGGGDALVVRVESGAAASTVALGATLATLTVAATADAVALAGFDHLAVTVTAGGADGEFTLDIDAVDAGGVTLQDGGGVDYSISVPLDVAGDIEADLAAAQTGTTPAIALAELFGDAPAARPDDGSADSADDGDGNQLASLDATGAVSLEAVNAGLWGDRLVAWVEHDTADPSLAHVYIAETDSDGNILRQESFFSVSLDPNAPRYLGEVLEQGSELARLVTSGAPEIGRPDEVAEATPSSFGSGDDGSALDPGTDIVGSAASRTGLYALDEADIFNLLCIPLASWSADSMAADYVGDLWTLADQYCRSRSAMLIIDPPSDWSGFSTAFAGAPGFSPTSPNAALFFPRVIASDPLQESRLRDFPPCGAVAGVFARTDAGRGVWKAPAGTEAGLVGVQKLAVSLSDGEQGALNKLGVNGLRSFPVYGPVIWGSRTLYGADTRASEWKYVSVRRMALYLHQSLYRGTRWAVFEPNDAPLWSELRLSIGGFMQRLFRQGAFQGATPKDAYFVKCDSETTTPDDQARGVVNVLIGFAPLKPAEFVVIKLQQIANSGQ